MLAPTCHGLCPLKTGHYPLEPHPPTFNSPMVASVPSCCSHLLEAHPSPKQNHVGPSHHPRPLPQSDSSTIRGWSTHGSIPGASSAWGGNHRTWVPSLPLGTRRSPSRCTGRAQSRSGYSYILGGGGECKGYVQSEGLVYTFKWVLPQTQPLYPLSISLLARSLGSLAMLPTRGLLAGLQWGRPGHPHGQRRHYIVFPLLASNTLFLIAL